VRLGKAHARVRLLFCRKPLPGCFPGPALQRRRTGRARAPQVRRARRAPATAVLALAALGSAPACAAQLDVAPVLYRFDYRESAAAGEQLDQETGTLLGLAGSWRTRLAAPWQLAAGLRWLSGDTGYDGLTQGGEPHRTSTRQRLLRLHARVARCVPRCDSRVALLAGLAGWRWQRDIEARGGVAALSEQYRWWELEVGTELGAVAGRGWRLGLSGLLIREPEVEVDLRAAGFGTPRLALGESQGARATLGWRAPPAAGSQWGLELSYERWKFGASETATISNGSLLAALAEPRSVSEHLMLAFALSF